MINTIDGLDVGNQPCLASHCWFSHRRTVPQALSSHTMLSEAQDELKRDPNPFCSSRVRPLWRELGKHLESTKPPNGNLRSLQSSINTEVSSVDGTTASSTVGCGAGQRFEASNRTGAVFPAYQTLLMRPHVPRKQGKLSSYEPLKATQI